MRLNNVHPSWEILEYNGLKNNCVLQHDCGTTKEFFSFENTYRRKIVCDHCISQNKIENALFKYNIGDMINSIEILGRKVDNIYKNQGFRKYYLYKCHICGFDSSARHYINGDIRNNTWMCESDLTRGKQCACCAGKVVQEGINDVATTNPELVKYFVDKSLAKKYSAHSNQLIDVLCPICNTQKEKQMMINTVSRQGVSCIGCGSSYSYPEKLMYFLLSQLHIGFEMHKSFEWSNGINHPNSKIAGNKEYDFYIHSHKLIIEMHGPQHYNANSVFAKYGYRGRTLEEEQENDSIKQKLAIDNGYNYIIIDCQKSNISYISSNIKGSKLHNYIDLHDVDWEQCNTNALYGIKLMVIEEKAKNPELKTTDLAKKYNVDSSTISKWLNQGKDICGYNPKEEIAHNRIFCYCEELGLAFSSISEARKYFNVSSKKVYKLFENNNSYGLPKLEKITKTQYYNWVKNNSIKYKEIQNDSVLL